MSSEESNPNDSYKLLTTNYSLMKVAIVHDFLCYWGGAERVVRGLHRILKDAPIYTLFYKRDFVKAFFPHADIRASFLHNVPFHRRFLLPFMPTAMEAFNLDEYDVIITSGTFAKGVITKPHAKHIHYCHTPPRFLWEEEEEYVRNNVPFGLKGGSSLLFHWLRLWDRHASERVDVMIANSEWTKNKIKKIYGREAKVIYPLYESFQFPVSSFQLKKNYFLIVSRLQRYKDIELAITVFNKLKIPLYIAGEGPDRRRLERLAGPTIKFLGFKSEEKLPLLYAHARGVILPGVEDFGLTVVEAMAQGTPALAYREGGARETIIEGKTGEFFDEQTVKSFWQGLQRFFANEKRYKAQEIVKQAEKFAFKVFERSIRSLIEK